MAFYSWVIIPLDDLWLTCIVINQEASLHVEVSKECWEKELLDQAFVDPSENFVWGRNPNPLSMSP